MASSLSVSSVSPSASAASVTLRPEWFLDADGLLAASFTRSPRAVVTATTTTVVSTTANLAGVQSAASKSSSTSSAAATHTITVGGNGNAFFPNSTTVPVGDIVEFTFFPSNHSVVRGDYGQPCIPYEYTGADRVGFFSGYELVESFNAQDSPKFRIQINSTEPIFYYCSQINSCIGHEMIGVINPNSTWTLASQMQYLANTDIALAPGDPIPSEMEGGGSGSSSSSSSSGSSGNSGNSGNSSSSGNSTSTPESSSSQLSTGAMAGIVVGSLAGLAVIGLLAFFFFRRQKDKESRGDPDNQNNQDSRDNKNVNSPASAAAVSLSGPSPAPGSVSGSVSGSTHGRLSSPIDTASASRYYQLQNQSQHPFIRSNHSLETLYRTSKSPPLYAHPEPSYSPEHFPPGHPHPYGVSTMVYSPYGPYGPPGLHGPHGPLSLHGTAYSPSVATPYTSLPSVPETQAFDHMPPPPPPPQPPAELADDSSTPPPPPAPVRPETGHWRPMVASRHMSDSPTVGTTRMF